MIQNHHLHLSLSYTSISYTDATERGYQENGRCRGFVTSGDWSGIRESNPRLDLGKVAYYHYTNPAWKFSL